MTSSSEQQQPIRLTQLSHGGGCGCKIAPAVLRDLLSKSGGLGAVVAPQLLVGTETSDDAAVYKLNDTQAIVATTDFFMPIVDDAFDFGRIAAANALSDVYAMGGKPLFALAVVGMPINKLPMETMQRILQGGESVCVEAGIPIAGGHSIDAPEPIYGLVGIGVVHPDHVKRNSSARPGDLLILGKPLGVGLMATAHKRGLLDAAGYARLVQVASQLNSVGAPLGALHGVHALTDVTGFALLGHALEVARGSNLGVEISLASVPLMDEAVALAQSGVVTGAGPRNWANVAEHVDWPAAGADWQRVLLTDPQTNGGLLTACDPSAADAALQLLHSSGFVSARVIGRVFERANENEKSIRIIA
jgi:selenide,water dikinase